jgi:hypothetical protein
MDIIKATEAATTTAIRAVMRAALSGDRRIGKASAFNRYTSLHRLAKRASNARSTAMLGPGTGHAPAADDTT